LLEAFDVRFPDGRAASAVRLAQEDDVVSAVRELGLGDAPACLVVIGGADAMSDEEIAQAEPVVRDALVPTAERLGAVVIDGGTDTGVMALMGRARTAAGASFPLVGVVVDRLAELPEGDLSDGSAPLEPNHSHFVLVPGSSWGDEAAALSRLAATVAPRRSATVVLNGGELSEQDVSMSIERGRPVIAVAGSGRFADSLAAATRGGAAGAQTESLAASGIVRAIDAEDLDAVVAVIDNLLTKEG
jgi:SLOG in TRPM, prokaryote